MSLLPKCICGYSGTCNLQYAGCTQAVRPPTVPSETPKPKSSYLKEYEQYHAYLKAIGGPTVWTEERVKGLNKVEILEMLKGQQELINWLDDIVYSVEEGCQQWEEKCADLTRENDKLKEEVKQAEQMQVEWADLAKSNKWDFLALKEKAEKMAGVWRSGNDPFPLLKKVLAKMYIGHLKREVAGWASSATGEMITFDSELCTISLRVGHKELNDLKWLDETPWNSDQKEEPSNG